MKLYLFIFYCLLNILNINALKNASPEMNQISDFCKQANDSSLIILEAENLVQRYLDSAFVYENDDDIKNLYNNFLQRRNNLSKEINERIDFALLNAPRKFIGDRIQSILQNSIKNGARVLVIFRKNDKFLYQEKILNLLCNEMKFVLGDLYKNWEPYSSEFFKNGILIASNQDLNKQLKIVAESQSNKPIKQIFYITANSDDKQILLDNLPIKTLKISIPITLSEKLSLNLLNEQLKFLEGNADWYNDNQIKELSQKSPKEILFHICKASILDICSCKEINEKILYNKLYNLLKNTECEQYIQETIEDFQEVNLSLLPILEFVGNKCFIEICDLLKIDNKILEQAKKITSGYEFVFNEHLIKATPFKILKQLGCKVHWKDIEKYNWLKNKIMGNVSKNSDNIFYMDSERKRRYIDIIEKIAFYQDIDSIIKKAKTDFLQIMKEAGLKQEKLSELSQKIGI